MLGESMQIRLAKHGNGLSETLRKPKLQIWSQFVGAVHCGVGRDCYGLRECLCTRKHATHEKVSFLLLIRYSNYHPFDRMLIIDFRESIPEMSNSFRDELLFLHLNPCM